MTGRATHIDPALAVALDRVGNVVNPDPLPALVELIRANIHKASGGAPGAMDRLTYLRQGSSVLAAVAASGVPLARRR